jgi:hypothetical protein
MYMVAKYIQLRVINHLGLIVHYHTIFIGKKIAIHHGTCMDHHLSTWIQLFKTKLQLMH